MKYLIFLALVVQALAGPAGRPDKHGPGFGRPFGQFDPKPSNPPPTGNGHFIDHYNQTGQPPLDNSSRPTHPEEGPHGPFDHHEVDEQSSHESSSRPPHQEGFNGHPRPRRHIPSGLPTPKTGNPPQDIDHRGPPPSGKPPVEAESRKPEQGHKPRHKRHLGAGNPTRAPHVDQTHQKDASRPPKPNHPGDGPQQKPGKPRSW
ncbi:uncharacterized protein RB166_019141 [Leptodactylus fuscus]